MSCGNFQSGYVQFLSELSMQLTCPTRHTSTTTVSLQPCECRSHRHLTVYITAFYVCVCKSTVFTAILLALILA